MFAHAGVVWSQRVRFAKPGFSMKCDFSSGSPLVFLSFDVSRWAVVTSFCLWNFQMWITVDSWHDDNWGMIHWMCLWKSYAFFYITVDMVCSSKPVIYFSVVIQFSSHSKYTHNFNFIDTTCSSKFDTGGGTKLKQFKKCIAPGAEMHRAMLRYDIRVVYQIAVFNHIISLSIESG